MGCSVPACAEGSKCWGDAGDSGATVWGEDEAQRASICAYRESLGMYVSR